MMAIFNYTAQQYPDERVNVLAIHGKNKTVYIPLEGIYSFLMTFPVLLTLSICMAKYSVFLDTLRKVAPERYRNHAAVAALRRQSLYPTSVAETALSGEGSHSPWTGRRRSTVPREPLSLSEDDLKVDWSCRPITGKSITGKPVAAASISVLKAHQQKSHEYLMVGRALDAETETETETDFNGFRGFDDSDSDGDEGTDSKNDPQLMCQAEIKQLDAKMRLYRGIVFGLAIFMMLAGLIIALLFMGSTEIDMQKRYLRAVAGFMIMSAVITAPIVLIVTSLRRHYVQRKQRQAMTDEEWKGRVAQMTVMATAIMMTQAMIYTEVGRAVKSSVNFNII
eukprot:m.172374 g.172374  ORF g.172374 m.172374 type:complete len:337 (-) comp14579_c1_seq1:234-1244(-)